MAGLSHIRGEGAHPAETDTVWARLARGSTAADPFSSGPAWQRSYLAAFQSDAPLFVRHDEERLAAFALFQDTGSEPFLAAPDRGWMFGRTLLGENASELLLELLDEVRDRASSVLLTGLDRSDADSMSMLLDLAARTRNQAIAHVSDMTMAQASLEGGRDGYWSRRDAKFRREAGRQQRRAAQRGVTFERCLPRDLDDAESAYRRMLALEERSWKGREGLGIGGRGSEDFYLVLLASLAATGDARVVFAKAGDLDIGFAFGGVAGTVYRGQQFSFDEAWGGLSIGNLLQDQMIAWLCEQGVERYDMGPEMPYMRRFAEDRATQSAFFLQF
jgi:CelD/BcsL family acetyltransferase involved in cellulose biosynthesis